jgi:hypothetical protein
MPLGHLWAPRIGNLNHLDQAKQGVELVFAVGLGSKSVEDAGMSAGRQFHAVSRCPVQNALCLSPTVFDTPFALHCGEARVDHPIGLGRVCLSDYHCRRLG